MKRWRLVGRCFMTPPSADWRAQLAQRLGQRPRRIGIWAELALYGALRCQDEAREPMLSAGALLSVSSLAGPAEPLHAALEELKTGLPMPIGFLQAQPSQLLPVLAQHLNWQGDARCLTTRDPLVALSLACRESGSEGALLGWVDCGDSSRSVWLRLLPADFADVMDGGSAAQFEDLADDAVHSFAFDAGRLLVWRERIGTSSAYRTLCC